MSPSGSAWELTYSKVNISNAAENQETDRRPTIPIT